MSNVQISETCQTEARNNVEFQSKMLCMKSTSSHMQAAPVLQANQAYNILDANNAS